MLEQIRKLMRPLAGTPLHPQWLLKHRMQLLAEYLRDLTEEQVVLDIGCFNKWPAAQLPATCRYIGLDYLPTARDWYGSTPDIFGDALRLPVADRAVDAVLLLDVLEHIADAPGAMREISRVLRPGGKLVIQIPFLYPLHDEPRDFTRLTVHGLEALAGDNGMTVTRCRAVGHPVETAALLMNIAISKTAATWLRGGNPAALLVFLAPPAILLLNLFARGVAFLSGRDDFMPHTYQLVLTRTA